MVSPIFTDAVLQRMPREKVGDSIMDAGLPVQGVKTLYTQSDDVLRWICVVGLLGLIALSIFLRIKLKKETT